MGTAAGIGRSPSPASSWITCVDIGAVAAGAVILGLALVPLLADPGVLPWAAHRLGGDADPSGG